MSNGIEEEAGMKSNENLLKEYAKTRKAPIRTLSEHDVPEGGLVLTSEELLRALNVNLQRRLLDAQTALATSEIETTVNKLATDVSNRLGINFSDYDVDVKTGRLLPHNPNP